LFILSLDEESSSQALSVSSWMALFQLLKSPSKVAVLELAWSYLNPFPLLIL